MPYGFHDFAALDGFGASDADGILRQTTMYFADTTARDAALTGGIVAEGMRAYLADSNTVTIYTGAAWEIEEEPPQAWSPTITQGSAVSGTVGRGWYRRQRGEFSGHLTWTATASGTASNGIIITTPVTLANLEDIGGNISYWDDSASMWRVGSIIADTTTQFRFIIDGGAAEYGVAGGDQITADDVMRVDIAGRY